MSAAIQANTPDLRTDLINWRERLEATVGNGTDTMQLSGLLREVSAAIERLGRESYGVCQVCHDLIGQAAMAVDPLAKTCLSCFTPAQLKELEQDLDRAWLIQGELLPKQHLKFNGWEVSYHYEPAGPVSGDYCDLVSLDNGDLYFLIGDVSGKGKLPPAARWKSAMPVIVRRCCCMTAACHLSQPQACRSGCSARRVTQPSSSK